MHFRKIEINDLKIVAPLKCGTRWLLERSDNSSFIYINYLKEETDSETIFLYREPNDHLISALHTDYIHVNKYDLNKTLDDLLNYKSPHWRGDIYENVHRAWTYNKFKMVNYLDISKLIDDYNFDKNMYDFSTEPYFLTKQMVLDLVPNDIKEELFKMVDSNDYWLKQILENNDKIISKNVIDRLENGYEKMTKKNQLLISNYELIIKEKDIIIESYRKNKGKKSLL